MAAQDTPKGLQITSVVALKALEAAQLATDDDASSERVTESIMDGPSTQTTSEDHQSYQRQETKPPRMSNYASNLEELRSRLRNPVQYINSLLELEMKIWSESTISMYTNCITDLSPSIMHKKNYGPNDFVAYPAVPPEHQDLIPNRLSEDPFPIDPTNTSDKEISALCQSAKDDMSSSHLNAIRTCRNIILITFLSLKLL